MSNCKKCGAILVPYGFYKCASCRRKYVQDWTERNREKVNLACRNWTANNVDRRKDILRRSDRKCATRRQGYKKDFYLNNKDKYKAWAAACDPESRRAIKYRYRARKAANGIEKYSTKAVFELGNNTCSYCGAKAKELDHVIPIARGGPDTISNVTPACVKCNRTKRIKTASEFMAPAFDKIKQLLYSF